MSRRVLFVFALLFLLPALVLAQDGKMRGRVTDKDSGEPLIGASIVIDGTTLGASADINGDYVVLSVPPGAYTVRVSYIGYQSLSVTNVRVSANLTTTQDFKLASTAVEVAGIEIVAERPLVQRNTTNTVRLTTQEDIENLAIRGVQNIVALNAGTVLQNGNLHVRGGRAGEVMYFVDGATGTNPLYRSDGGTVTNPALRTPGGQQTGNSASSINVIQEAVEEIQLQSGGYTAEFGGANAGIVRTSVRTGSSDFKASIDYRTDDFAKPGEQFLGTSAFGYRNAVLTLSGPIMNKLRFFVAGQHNYLRDRDMRFVAPFAFEDLATDALGSRPAGEPLPGTFGFEENYIPGNTRRDNSLNGTLAYDLSSSLKFRFTGTYQAIDNPVGKQWPLSVDNFYRLRDAEAETRIGFGNLKITHVINPKTFYEAAVFYSNRTFHQIDETFGENWQLYSDSTANANAGYPGFISRWEGPLAYSVVQNFEFRHPNQPIETFYKNSQEDIGGSLDVTSQITKRFELKIGGRYDRWTMRQLNVRDIPAFMTYAYGRDGKSPRTFESDLERKVRLDRAGVIDRYGYDLDGNKIDTDPDGALHPEFLAFYAQSKLEYRDLILNFGLRYERIGTNAWGPTNFEEPAYDDKLNYPIEDQLTQTKAEDYVLPRVNFSFPVTDKTVFYATYGKYVQLPRLTDVYTGNRILGNSVSPVTRSVYGYFGQWAGFTAKPERTTQYEMGLRQSVTDNFAFTLTGFYKDHRDLLRFDTILADGNQTLPAGQAIFSGLVNNDIATVKGLEMTLELRRTKRLAAKVNYTLSSTKGTGSDSRSTQVAVSDGGSRYPIQIYNLTHHQPHRGSLVMDYRWSHGDGGPILQGLGLNAILNFNSGHSYTQIRQPASLGQSDPWNVGVYPLSDPRFSNPVEPLNKSLTPWNFNVDLNLNKNFRVSNQLGMEVYVNVLNLLNSQNVINFFPNTGTAEDDGWLRSPGALSYVAIPGYADFYNAINLENRYAYQNTTGNDLYASPRQIRLGVKLELQ
jgi:hypothetical protein